MQFSHLELDHLRQEVNSGNSRPEEWRRKQLRNLKELINQNETEILNALSEDLNKPKTEGFFEILSLRQEISLVEKELSKWMNQKKINLPLWLKPGEATVRKEPLGCILIIGPWNYPFMLTLQPLISALAAGNTAILKPSEFAPVTSELIERLIDKYFSINTVKVFQGNANDTEKLLLEKFDHIFFTGGSQIGKKIMLAAAKNLTPVTLELGGQNPVLVVKKANLDITAKRIIWGKVLNCGQTCLAPNHLLVSEELKDNLIEKMKININTFYGSTPEKSLDLASLNDKQFEKLVHQIEQARKHNKIIFGGSINFIDRKICPTLINIENMDDEILSEEIFGPILPILSISNFNEGLNIIKTQEKPLAIYMFGGSEQERNDLLQQTHSGGICFNDVIMQAGMPELPFGGIGESGMGQYHGKAGFETFSHKRAVLSRPFWIDLNFRYPPYKMDLSLLSKLIK